ncbi:MAG: phosphate acyltransferase PlsX [Ruminiclostridium sp.]|nr:phosphate acyltransferase PlsX [Ruminiclostridium sp.]
MKIVVDAFGGDNAPDEVVKGAVEAVKEYGVTVVLSGDTKKLDECFTRLGLSKDNIEFAEADGVIEIEDDPKQILKEKKNSSMGVALTMVAEGKADAMVSAGSTAALVMGGTLIVKRIKGVKRPSLTPVMPGVDNMYILLDGGANVDCRPDMLRQFAVMGSIYMNRVMGVNNPRVGLLNVGAEEEKGRDLELQTYALLKNSNLNFTGNVEARDAALGAVDVVVTDGFTGNVFLKTVEGMGKFMKKALKERIFGGGLSKVGALFCMKGIKSVSKQMDYREVGGSPLLGTAKPVIKAHGSSDALAFKNAIRQAKQFAEGGVIDEITKALASIEAAE